MVQYIVSGHEADLQACKVASNEPGFPMRVECKAFKQWGAGAFIVYGKSSIRQVKGSGPKAGTRKETESGTYSKPSDKTVLAFDDVFGLGLAEWMPRIDAVPRDIAALAAARWDAKKARNWPEADRLRTQIRAAGFEIEDESGSYRVKRRSI